MAIQAEEARKLQEKWGDKPCSHAQTDKEYYLATQTGDRVCIQCGFTASPEYFKNNK